MSAAVRAIAQSVRYSAVRLRAPMAVQWTLPRTLSVRPNREALSQRRWMSAAAGLSREVITGRVMDVLKNFDKVEESKLKPNSNFTKDLGLDSLDSVEVVMAIEEEFSIEIPDAEADQITSVKEAIDYIVKTPEVHFETDLLTTRSTLKPRTA